MGLSRTHFFSPSRTILLSMIFSIIAGTLLLSLPCARIQEIPAIDLLFTSTSSICVTGLLTVPMKAFSFFGQAVILLLMQIGGLGLITLTLFIVSLFVNLGLSTQVLAGEMLDLESWKGTRKTLVFIIAFTLICELVGAIFLFLSFKEKFPYSQAIFYSIFHSVSAFCNCGITLFDNSILNYSHDYIVLSSMSLLIILGSIGFITLKELFERYNPFKEEDKHYAFSLQSKIILSYYAILTCMNTGIFWLLERHNTFEGMSLWQQLSNSFFTAVSCRSSGFLTVYTNNLQNASIFNILINGFIGSAPASTGSGIKITTAALFIATISAAIQGSHVVNIRGRRIMKDQIYKALAVVSLSIFWIITTAFFLLITEQTWNFVDICCEALSAFTTLGVSTGITPYLSFIGKNIIILNMFIGRIGSLTLMIALRKRMETQEFLYPEERVMIS